MQEGDRGLCCHALMMFHSPAPEVDILHELQQCSGSSVECSKRRAPMQEIFRGLQQCRQLDLQSCRLTGPVFGFLAATAATLTDLSCGGHPGRVRNAAWEPWSLPKPELPLCVACTAVHTTTAQEAVSRWPDCVMSNCAV